MQTVHNDGSPIKLEFAEDISLTLYPANKYEYLMPLKEVALGYGVSPNTIRGHIFQHKDEIVEGVHFVRSVCFSNTSTNALSKGVGISNTLTKAHPHAIHLTKAGIVRLGFFIKSERAKAFRDWAEKVILAVTAPKVSLPKEVKRNHNRLNQARLIEILAVVALVDDKNIRTTLIQKLMPDLVVPGIQLEIQFDRPALMGKGGIAL